MTCMKHYRNFPLRIQNNVVFKFNGTTICSASPLKVIARVADKARQVCFMHKMASLTDDQQTDDISTKALLVSITLVMMILIISHLIYTNFEILIVLSSIDRIYRCSISKCLSLLIVYVFKQNLHINCVADEHRKS